MEGSKKAMIQRRLQTIENHFTSGTTEPNFTPNALEEKKFVNQFEFIMMGLRTIPEGNAAVIMNLYGSSRIVEGPQIIFLFCEYFSPTLKHTAGTDQYLRIKKTDGTIENIPGPVTVYFNPKDHEEIAVYPAITVASGYAIVVYERQAQGPSKRKVVTGPCDYQLKENESLHTFFWNIPDQKNPNIKQRKLLKFHRLRTIPDSLYFDVIDVRTKDDALLKIQLMLFFHLVEAEKMIDNTHDPVAEMINTCTADVVTFVAGKTFEEFKSQSHQLNNINSFPNVIKRMDHLGYTLNQIVFRGFITSDILQQISNKAIESRTKLRLEEETEKQQQDLKDLEQGRSHQRRNQEIVMSEKENQAVLELSEKKVHQNFLYLQRLKGLGVDLNQVLADQPSQHIKLSGELKDMKPRLNFNMDK